jgi:hypothetical protein
LHSDHSLVEDHPKQDPLSRPRVFSNGVMLSLRSALVVRVEISVGRKTSSDEDGLYTVTHIITYSEVLGVLGVLRTINSIPRFFPASAIKLYILTSILSTFLPSSTMTSGSAGMSRVQRELLELREKGLATNQRDKYKDCKLVVYCSI